jgi:hypothetical protein
VLAASSRSAALFVRFFEQAVNAKIWRARGRSGRTRGQLQIHTRRLRVVAAAPFPAKKPPYVGITTEYGEAASTALQNV